MSAFFFNPFVFPFPIFARVAIYCCRIKGEGGFFGGTDVERSTCANRSDTATWPMDGSLGRGGLDTLPLLVLKNN